MNKHIPPALVVPDATEQIAVVRTLQDAVEVFRTMKDRLGLTNEFIDEVGGLVKGHTDKILGRTETKRLGYDTFALFTELFGLRFEVYIDVEAVKRMEKVWEMRKRPLFPHRKPGRVSKKLIDMARPHVFKACASSGGTKRAHSLPAKLRSKIARKGGKSRMRKITKEERSAMSLKGWETKRKNRSLIAVEQASGSIALLAKPA